MRNQQLMSAMASEHLAYLILTYLKISEIPEDILKMPVSPIPSGLVGSCINRVYHELRSLPPEEYKETIEAADKLYNALNNLFQENSGVSLTST